MSQHIRFVGLDVHSDSISIAIADPGVPVRSVGQIANDEHLIRKWMKRLGMTHDLRVCYEAGPGGFVLYWQLTRMGIPCTVIAPSLIPRRPGDRRKTDRRDAMMLADAFRSNSLTPCWIPTAEQEALRDLVRAREAAVRDHTRARHRLTKFLLRQGRRCPNGLRKWTTGWWTWLRQQRFDHIGHTETFLDYLHEVEHAIERIKRLECAIESAIEGGRKEIKELVAGLSCLRGVGPITAVTLVAEIGTFERFEHPRDLMGYVGVIPSEHSSGTQIKRGGITKTGNAHIRRVIGEAAWTYRHRPAVYGALKKRQRGLSEEVKAIAWRAQHRLHRRYRVLTDRGKPYQVVVTAVGRELLAFAWEIGMRIYEEQRAA